MDGWMHEWMAVCLSVCLSVCVHLRTYVCMHTCMHAHVFHSLHLRYPSETLQAPTKIGKTQFLRVQTDGKVPSQVPIVDLKKGPVYGQF